MGIVLTWSTGYNGTIGSIDDRAIDMPTLADGVHDVVASHVNTLANAVITLQTKQADLLVSSTSHTASIATLSPLTVREIDGAPSISSANTIEFTNGTVTSMGGGVARVTIAGASNWRDVTATVATIVSDITLDVTVGVYTVDTAAARTLTLPAPGTATGKMPWLFIGNGSDGNNITLSRFGAEKIDGVAASKILSAKYGRWFVYTDGTDWHTLDVSVNLSFARVKDGLAAANTDISVNGQKISSLGTPTVGTDAATKAYVDAAGVPPARQIISGGGLTGGGDLSADRTLVVGAHADGSIAVAADTVQVGVLASDAQHGARGGGTQHAIATTAADGFMDDGDVDMLYERRRRTTLVDEFNAAQRYMQESADAGATFVRILDSADAEGVYRASLLTLAGASYLSYGGSASGTVGSGQNRIAMRLKLETVPSAAEDFVAGVGICTSASLAAASQAVLVCDRTVSTGFWVTRTKNAGVVTTTITTVALSTAWVYLEVVVNAAGTSVAFLIDGALVATHTTNLPTAAMTLYRLWQFARVAGATDRTMLVDLVIQDRIFTTPR